MPAKVIRCTNLHHLLQQWIGVVQNQQPNGYFEIQGHRYNEDDQELPSLFDHLTNTARIQWFYYTDNANGIAVRVYDQPFKDQYSEDFHDTLNDPWVILRGKDIGPENGPCKTAMAGVPILHNNNRPARQAPSNNRQNPATTDLVAANETQRRVYFEDQFHNNQQVGPALFPNALPNATFGQIYNQPISVANAAGLAYTFSVVGGPLPNALDLNPQNGMLTGILTAVGDFPIRISATTPTNNQPLIKDYTLTVNPSPPPPERGTVEMLRQFRQIILYGPPGTGKTRQARRAALELLLGPEPVIDILTEAQVGEALQGLKESGSFNLVVFHPAYEYEQFVGGIAPELAANGLGYRIEAGVFLRMARWIQEHNQPAVLMIDEINRGNLPKLLGELVYALEYRDTEVQLPFEWNGSSALSVPATFYIIGTMNSSDRSIGHIDVAVRRRFGLLRVDPDTAVVHRFWEGIDPQFGAQLVRLMKQLNHDLCQRDRAGELQVGHAYFLADPNQLNPQTQVHRKWTNQVQQLLLEYGQVLNLDEAFNNKYLHSNLDEVFAMLNQGI